MVIVTQDKKPIISLRGISKKFPGVQALDHVDLDIYPGEIHAILGENGAGKSTLIKILSGIIRSDSGEIYYDGTKIEFRDPHQAIDFGIAVVHQEFFLVPSLSIAENIFLGRWPKGKVGISWLQIYKEADGLLKRYGLEKDGRASVKELSMAEQQIVEILRAISQPNTRILLLDEPTSALSEEEIDRLLKTLLEVKRENKAIIFISHKITEALKIADKITILKDGRKVTTAKKGELTEADIIYHMTGKRLKSKTWESQKKEEIPLLSLRNFSVGNILKDINLDVYKGEILVIFGLLGSGKTTLARGIFGLEKAEGEVIIEGKRYTAFSNPCEAIEEGTAYIPEDRKKGLIYQFPVVSNITLSLLKRLSKKGILDLKKEVEIAKNYVDTLRIKTPDIFRRVLYLSGGNQQKVLLARWLAREPKILLMDEPTRGIDVGAKFEIREMVKKLVRSGLSVIYITSEAPEALEMGDRIVIMKNRRIVKIFEDTTNLTKESLLLEVS